MPAQVFHRIDEKGLYFHIYNIGLDNRIIFNDQADYDTFLEYLKDYLSPPKDPHSTKQDFNVNGRTFRGIPHQPKNYFKTVELISYSLLPDHFHLILHQKAEKSIEKFIRSLCTRYSMYFNKKYKRGGAVFAGPYRSVLIEVGLRLNHLTRFLHLTRKYSSYSEYLGLRKTPWVKPDVVLNLFDTEKMSYKNFVEKDQPDQNLLLEKTTFDNISDHLERTLERNNPTSNAETLVDLEHKPYSRIPKFLITSSVVLVLLVTLGIRNIMALADSNTYGPPVQVSYGSFLGESHRTLLSRAVLGITEKQILPSTEKKEVTPTPQHEVIHEIEPTTPKEIKQNPIITIRTEDGSSIVNIRQEATTSAKLIGKAKHGDTFALISKDSDWYQIKLSSGSAGFVSARFVAGDENSE